MNTNILELIRANEVCEGDEVLKRDHFTWLVVESIEGQEKLFICGTRHEVLKVWAEDYVVVRRATPVCMRCKGSVEGKYAIHLSDEAALYGADDKDQELEVPLCAACGGGPTPTCEEIWQAFRQRKVPEHCLVQRSS